VYDRYLVRDQYIWACWTLQNPFEGEATWLARSLGCSVWKPADAIRCLRNKSAVDIQSHSEFAQSKFTPSVDGDFVPQHPAYLLANYTV